MNEINAAQNHEPSRDEIDQHKGAVMLEFGAEWCGYCQSALPMINAALGDYPQIRHIKIEDGKGRRLGRSYQVKLWPTLIFIKNGVELHRLVRPENIEEIKNALALIN